MKNNWIVVCPKERKVWACYPKGTKLIRFCGDERCKDCEWRNKEVKIDYLEDVVKGNFILNLCPNCFYRRGK